MYEIMSFIFASTDSLEIGNWGGSWNWYRIHYRLIDMQIWSREWKRTIELSLYIDALSYMIRWYLDMEKADIINRKIAEHRKMIKRYLQYYIHT